MQSAGQCILLHHVLEMTSRAAGGDAPSFASPFQTSEGARGCLQSTLEESIHLIVLEFCCFSEPQFSVLSDWALHTHRFYTDLSGLSIYLFIYFVFVYF